MCDFRTPKEIETLTGKEYKGNIKVTSLGIGNRGTELEDGIYSVSASGSFYINVTNIHDMQGKWEIV